MRGTRFPEPGKQGGRYISQDCLYFIANDTNTIWNARKVSRFDHLSRPLHHLPIHYFRISAPRVLSRRNEGLRRFRLPMYAFTMCGLDQSGLHVS
jgi:hypothetical protein